MTIDKSEFKRRWEKDEDGDGITYDDIADCAVAWGIHSNPKTRPIGEIVNLVLAAADTE